MNRKVLIIVSSILLLLAVSAFLYIKWAARKTVEEIYGMDYDDVVKLNEARALLDSAPIRTNALFQTNPKQSKILIDSQATKPTVRYSIDKLHGEWIFIDIHKGKLTMIDTLKKEAFKSKFGATTWTYNKTGEYINNQGDYTIKGKFTFERETNLVKLFDDNGTKGDTSVFEVTYLDSKYLLIADEHSHATAFYKRK